MGTLSLLEAAREYWNGDGRATVLPHLHRRGVRGAGATRPEGAAGGERRRPFGEEFFTERRSTPRTALLGVESLVRPLRAGLPRHVRMPTLVTNCSNNYGPYQFPEKLIPLFINNIRHQSRCRCTAAGRTCATGCTSRTTPGHRRDLPQGQGRRHVQHRGFNEWKNIDLIRVIVRTVDRLLGNPEGSSEKLITYVTDRAGHDLRYAIDSRKLKRELGWQPSLQFEEESKNCPLVPPKPSGWTT